MTSPKHGLASCLFLLLLSGCAPDRELPLEAEGRRRSLLEAVVLSATVEPSQALYSERVEVTLSGAGLLAEVLAVHIDTVPASQITRVDDSTIIAVFEGGTPERVGSHAVTVHLAGGITAKLPNEFRWYHDQDPVVFVHGCPLPRELDGSVTNYVTSKYWHTLYNGLKQAGYPGPKWAAQEDFVGNGFKHAATRPAPNNYLNVFVLSEDSRDPEHVETAPPTQGAGHCGSGLLMALELNAYVDEVLKKTGASRVDLVVNSGGGLGARWFLHPNGYGGAARVRDVVFLAAMNHGTEVAVVPAVYDGTSPWWSPNYEMAREGFPAYACGGMGRGGRETNTTRVGNWDGRDLQELVNGCFTLDGRIGDGSTEIPGDHRQTPERAGGVAYLSIYNATVDELIEPTSSACLNQAFPGDCSDLEVNVPVHAYAPDQTPHGAIRMDPEVIELTICHVRRRSHTRPAPTGDCEEERAAAITSPPGSE